MNVKNRKAMFLGIIGLLAAVAIILSIVIVLQGPRTSTVPVISDNGNNEMTVDDLYEGKMTIPKFDFPSNKYLPDQFTDNNGVITFDGEDSTVGVSVNEQSGDVDWAAVKQSGVDFAMIRVGYRGKGGGQLLLDTKFEANVKAASEAGLKIGVYFFSQAVTDNEALEEANFVLEKIRLYQVEYPVAIYWQYVTDANGEPDIRARTTGCNGDQVTGFIQTFCSKVKAAGFNASFFADKNMGYEKLNLSLLKDYQLWYAESKKAPSFYYDFTMWQYTSEADVPGISVKVPINIAMKKYSVS